MASSVKNENVPKEPFKLPEGGFSLGGGQPPPLKRNKFKGLVKKRVLPVVTGGRANEKGSNEPQAKKRKRTVQEVLNNLNRTKVKFASENAFRNYVQKEAEPENFKGFKFGNLLAKYLEPIPEEGTASSLSSQLKSLQPTPGNASSSRFNRSMSASSAGGSSFRSEESRLNRNLAGQNRNAEIQKFIGKITINKGNTPSNLKKKLKPYIQSLTVRNIHRLYGGGLNGKPFNLGHVLRNAKQELPVQQFEAAQPKTRPSKKQPKVVNVPLRELVPVKPPPKQPKVNTESLNWRLKNWAAKGYGASGLFKEYPKSWNNVATAIRGMNKFKGNGNGVTANKLREVFPVYATNYEKFLKKRFHYERPANKPANLRGSKKSATTRVGENFNVSPNPVFVPTANRSRAEQLKTNNKRPRGPIPRAAPAASRTTPKKQKNSSFLGRLEEKTKSRG
jgi:hypothetical protein